MQDWFGYGFITCTWLKDLSTSSTTAETQLCAIQTVFTALFRNSEEQF